MTRAKTLGHVVGTAVIAVRWVVLCHPHHLLTGVLQPPSCSCNTAPFNTPCYTSSCPGDTGYSCTDPCFKDAVHTCTAPPSSCHEPVGVCYSTATAPLCAYKLKTSGTCGANRVCSGLGFCGESFFVARIRIPLHAKQVVTRQMTLCSTLLAQDV